MIVSRTTTENANFKRLVQSLDQELAITDGDEHSFYDQFNGLENINHVLIMHDEKTAFACGAIKHFDDATMEIKRMYTLPDYRGKGIGSSILTALEQWASELQYKRCLLETGKRQPDAIALYKKNGYVEIPNYGQYVGKENSVCFQKIL
ncbi:MAG: GNAT family N-acetyltransferase [Flavobacteriaceae bacterium]|nr:GNAT family N-acetyltransferase [Flavobacteriaceae bacterium]|tara:strand:- start:1628 stop:2074 length:447 start_codon:yes stop_codon:yes gene_type:complete